MQRRRRTSLVGELRILAGDLARALALPVALLEFYASLFAQVFVASHPENDPYLRPWKVAKDSILLALLVAAYLQYYFLDVLVQIAALPVLIIRV